VTATAFAPATVSNVACGFDVLGFAIGAGGDGAGTDGPGDRVTARLMGDGEGGVRVVSVTGIAGSGFERLPTEAARNTAGVAAMRLVEAVRPGARVELSVEKRMPFGSGLGSSAASAVAAVVAVNAVLGQPLPTEALLPFALDGEAVASGGRHADNVAPCLFGGFVLVRAPDDVVRLPVPAGLCVAVLHPHVEVLTADARAALAATVPLRSMVEQTANLGALVAALFTGDLDLLKRSLYDVVVEPQRAHLVPNFSQIQDAAWDAGALGCSLSGSGPSVFALCRSHAEAKVVGASMQAELYSLPSTVYVSGVGPGVRLVPSA
jgi:homoserine kinase